MTRKLLCALTLAIVGLIAVPAPAGDAVEKIENRPKVPGTRGCPSSAGVASVCHCLTDAGPAAVPGPNSKPAAGKQCQCGRNRAFCCTPCRLDGCGG